MTKLAYDPQLARYEELTTNALYGRRSNELLAVAKLCPDILIEIFMTVQASFLERYEEALISYNHDHRAIARFGWLTVTHVCHYWRTIALETPKLWATLYPVPAAWIQEFLQRSRGAPLTLRFVTPDSFHEVARLEHETSLDLALQALPRAEQLVLRIPEASLDRVHRFATGQDLGNLRRIVLQNLTQCYDSEREEHSHQLLKFDCHPPSLTHLAIANFPIRWNERFFVPTLTHLTLQTHDTASSRPSFLVEPLLKMLSTLPRLTNITLGHMFKHSSDAWAAASGASVIQLPELREIDIWDLCGPMTYLISHLQVPSSCRIALHQAPNQPALRLA
ncbi:hypothetical protein K474DRAFT_1771193 [Panus rudis PR-1116 ss-1]|nr:hypothetical protein K474DRAFT_1771193 [Panus rudis PR-1116 ss-1]